MKKIAIGCGVIAGAGLAILGLTMAFPEHEAEWFRSIPALLLLWAQAAAGEIVFRGFVLDRGRALELPVAGIVLLAAAGSAAISFDGTAAGFVGASVQGIGYGVLYYAAERNLLLPIFTRGAFETTLVFLS